jgi:hypothetical protein
MVETGVLRFEIAKPPLKLRMKIMEVEPLSTQELDAFMSGLGFYLTSDLPEPERTQAAQEIIKTKLPCGNCPFKLPLGDRKSIDSLSDLLLTGEYFCQEKQQPCQLCEQLKQKLRDMYA